MILSCNFDLSGKLHRYDGVIRGQEVKKDGVTNFFLRHTGMEAKQYRKELSEDARQSVNVFLPDWQTAKSSASGSGGEAMIMKIKLIHQSLQTNYCTIMQAMWERDLVQLFKDVCLSFTIVKKTVNFEIIASA